MSFDRAANSTTGPHDRSSLSFGYTRNSYADIVSKLKHFIQGFYIFVMIRDTIEESRSTKRIVMKASQFKLLLICVLAVSLMNLLGLGVALIYIGSLKSKVSNLNGGSSDATQLSNIQGSIGNLTDKVNALPTSTIQPDTVTPSKTMNCSGTLSQNLSGSASQIGSFTDYNLSGNSPIDLTCNNL